MEIKIPIVIDDRALEEAIDKRVAKLKQEGDFVLVIRCKDCKYWQDNNNGYPHTDCRWSNNETPDADDFCSYAEQKEIEGEEGMKLIFDYNPERHEVSFTGDGFRISSVVANYEDIGEFAKRVIEHDILIPNLKHREFMAEITPTQKGEDD